MQSSELEKLIDGGYIPSESERRKAVMMYFLVWLIIGLIKGLNSKYEKYHFYQAMWWWFVFIVLLLVSILFLFIPFVRLIPILFILFLLIINWIYIYQAIEGKYTINEDKIVFPVFYWLGKWIGDLFEIEDSDNLKDNQNK